MRLPVSRCPFRIEQHRIGESGIAVKRIAKQNKQPALVRPTFTRLNHAVAYRDLGVEDLPKLRTKQIEMIAVDCSWHDQIITVSSAAKGQNPTNFERSPTLTVLPLDLATPPRRADRTDCREISRMSRLN